jgi:hypothetical protein
MTSLAPAPPDRLTLRPLVELAAATGVSRYTLAYAARTGAMEAQRLGSQWVSTLAAVEAWLKDSRHRPGRPPRRHPPEASPPEGQTPAKPVT